MSNLISPDALAALLHERPDTVKLIDASYSGEAFDTFSRLRIADAVFFDIDDIADKHSGLPHTIPSPDLFAEKVGALGIHETDDLIVYDQNGIHMAASRVWWMFRLYGHQGKVQVLNGGLPAWIGSGHKLSQDAPKKPEKAIYKANLNADLVAKASELNSPGKLVLDVRSAGRFAGVLPEPRPGLRPGHMPGSVNVPFMDLIDAKTGALADNKALITKLEKYTISPRKLVTSCGSGVTACVVALALAELGRDDVAVYDGSWTEWGAIDSGYPVTTDA
jgi:thiosulfate/3-mercaptopyruvate sulfurtransferase